MFKYKTYEEAVANNAVAEHMADVEALQEELQSITLENIKKYPEYKSRQDDFYSMWQKFGPDAARTVLIPYIWDGRLPRPSEAIK